MSKNDRFFVSQTIYFSFKKRLISQFFQFYYLQGMCGMMYSEQQVSSTLSAFAFREEETETTTQEVRFLYYEVLILLE